MTIELNTQSLQPDFTGRVAIITGGTGALGGAVVRAFAAAGITIVVPYAREESFAALREGLGDLAERVSGRRADVTEAAEVEGLVRGTLDQYGRIDVLLNLVGGYQGGKFLETSIDLWDRLFRLNFRSALLCTYSALPSMVEHGSGRIVSVASRQALEPGSGSSAYSTAKTAVVALTETVAREIRTTGVTINCVAPSTIDTEANRQEMPKGNPERWVPPERIASLLLYLCSDAAAAINGAVIPVYGQL